MTYLFVYGIFKRGGAGNHMLLKECEYLAPATAPGFVLLNHTGPAAMVPGTGYRMTRDDIAVKGDLLGIPDELREEVFETLDRVEANGRSYIRAKIEVVPEDGPRVEAYAYLWMEYYSPEDIVEDGCWGRSFGMGRGAGL